LRSSRAIPLQQCGHFRCGGQYNVDWLVYRSVEVNGYLVKANLDIGADGVWTEGVTRGGCERAEGMHSGGRCTVVGYEQRWV